MGPALRRSMRTSTTCDLMASPPAAALGKLLTRMVRHARVGPLVTETVTEARPYARVTTWSVRAT